VTSGASASKVADSEEFTEAVLATYDDNTYTEQFECHVTGSDDRTEYWLEHRSTPIESGAYAGGRVELYYDVTGRKRAEQARREEYREFTSLVEAVEEYAIFTLDTEGRVQTWNPGAERIKGYEREEILGEHFSRFYTAGSREAGVPEENLAAATAEGSVEDEGWRVRADGSRFWAHVTITAIRDDDGTLRGYAKVTRDLTDRREYEQKLREEKAFTESILDNQRDLVYAFDTDGTFLRWNDRFRAVTGYSDASIERMRLVDFVADDATDELAAALDRVFEDEESVTVELPLETAAGEQIPYEFTGSPMRNDDGIVGLTGVGRDVSDRKARERRLERQRDELRGELDEMFDRIDDAFLGLDADWRITYLNERAAELLGRAEGALVGRDLWDAFPDALERSYRERYERSMETQEPVTFEEYSDAAETWLEVSAYPSETGLSLYFRDISERKQRERELERYETIVETIWDGVYALDDDDRFVLVNQAFCDLVGYDREELLGEHPRLVNSDSINEAANELATEIIVGERDVGVLEHAFETATGETVSVETRFGPYEYEEGRYGRCGVARDVTARKERERQLEESRRRYQTLVENFPNGAVALVDEDLRYVTIGGTPLEEAGVTMDELVGSPVDEILPDDLAELLVPRYEAALDGEASTFERTTGDTAYLFRVVPVRDDDGAVFAAMGMSQDVTEQKEYERYLEDAKSQLEAATEAGAIGIWEWRVQEDQMVTGPSLARMFGVDPDAARDGVSLDRFTSSIHEDDRDRVEREVDDAMDSCGEFESEFRVENADGEYQWVVARGHVECDEDGEPVTFPGALTDITERKQAEMELKRQREQLEALNNINEVVHEITRAVIEQSTREEIEAIVCERLADSDSYSFAWIGDVDTPSQTVNLRTEAGVEGYLDDITISIDPDDERSAGATGRALRTGEIQTTQDVRTDDRYDPWRGRVDRYGFRSSAAIPIVHEGTVYGALNVYADRPDAFEGREQEVISQLGDVVGHAIAAAERKRALMSDDLVELEFWIHDVFEALDLPGDTNGRITLDHAVPVGDDEFLVYGTATPDAVATVEALVETGPHWESVTIRSEDDPATFEARLTDPPVLSVVASLGGYVERTVIEDGDYQMTIHLAPTVNVRRVIDAVEDAYPAAEMLRRRQISRERDDPRHTQRHLLADLTDRQRTALEAAYHAGFFEWPRDATGEDVAASIGVAPPTFHHHLRKAERKVFDGVFSSLIQRVE
jgi:PAS domain S-box-containing protein